MFILTRGEFDNLSHGAFDDLSQQAAGKPGCLWMPCSPTHEVVDGEEGVKKRTFPIILATESA